MNRRWVPTPIGTSSIDPICGGRVTLGRLFTPNSTAVARFGAVVTSSPADRRCDARRISSIASSGPTPGHSRDEVVDFQRHQSICRDRDGGSGKAVAHRPVLQHWNADRGENGEHPAHGCDGREHASCGSGAEQGGGFGRAAAPIAPIVAVLDTKPEANSAIGRPAYAPSKRIEMCPAAPPIPDLVL